MLTITLLIHFKFCLHSLIIWGFFPDLIPLQCWWEWVIKCCWNDNLLVLWEKPNTTACLTTCPANQEEAICKWAPLLPNPPAGIIDPGFPCYHTAPASPPSPHHLLSFRHLHSLHGRRFAQGETFCTVLTGAPAWLTNHFSRITKLQVQNLSCNWQNFPCGFCSLSSLPLLATRPEYNPRWEGVGLGKPASKPPFPLPLPGARQRANTRQESAISYAARIGSLKLGPTETPYWTLTKYTRIPERCAVGVLKTVKLLLFHLFF